mmetsp:Transcript_3508/g.14144  ORF Transcript_3508/g.14144 Transcript_3508/m.14144 type:complete len:313 (-) Transcript_3508:142-1080(-)
MDAFTGKPTPSVALTATRTCVIVSTKPRDACNGEFSSMTCRMFSGNADVHRATFVTSFGNGRLNCRPPPATSTSVRCGLYRVTDLCRMTCMRTTSSFSVSTQSGLNTTCRSGFSARATITAPATESNSQWHQPSAASTKISVPELGARAAHPKMESVLSRTAVNDRSSFSRRSSVGFSDPPSVDRSAMSTAHSVAAKTTITHASSATSRRSRRDTGRSTVSRCHTSSARLTESSVSSPSPAALIRATFSSSKDKGASIPVRGSVSCERTSPRSRSAKASAMPSSGTYLVWPVAGSRSSLPRAFLGLNSGCRV